MFFVSLILQRIQLVTTNTKTPSNVDMNTCYWCEKVTYIAAIPANAINNLAIDYIVLFICLSEPS